MLECKQSGRKPVTRRVVNVGSRRIITGRDFLVEANKKTATDEQPVQPLDHVRQFGDGSDLVRPLRRFFSVIRKAVKKDLSEPPTSTGPAGRWNCSSSGALAHQGFFGTSQNAVKTQIWIAISIYVLVAIVRKELKLTPSLYQILQVASVNISSERPFYRPSSNIIPEKNRTHFLTS